MPVLVLVGLVAFATIRRRGGQDEDRFDFDDAGFDGQTAHAYTPLGTAERSTSADEYSAAMFGDRYGREGLGTLSSGRGDVPAEPEDVWGAPPPVDDEDEEALELAEEEEDEDPDAVDTTPTRVPTMVERDPLTDTGRHSRVEADRIEADQTEAPRTAFRLSLVDSDEPPEGYPVKADTKSGRYWVPDSPRYDDAYAEIWFASEELARANGFVSDD